ncbi:hypothetical protein [Streptococcus uberis]|uniref:hypothetical protein n=1 Tax=Streptococcus uberis TaxID=1349 RepID=UPI001939CCF1|nr:hypothetical protein [Streptococcus uberis]
MGIVGDYVTGKTDIKALKKKLDKLLVTSVHAPRKKHNRRSIVSTYDDKIETTASTAKASITAIAGQIDTAIKGQFRTKVEIVLDNNSTKYDDI